MNGRPELPPAWAGYEAHHAYNEALRPWLEAARPKGSYRIEVDEDGMETVVENVVIVEATITVLQQAVIIEPSEYTRTIKQIANRVEAHGWEFMVKRSRFRVSDVPYVTDDAEGKYNRGDIKTPAHDRLGYGVLGVRYNEDGDQALIAFSASWEQSLRESPTSGKIPSPEFQGADTYDPILGREWRGRFQEPNKPYVGERVLAMPLKSWLQIVAPVEGETKKKPSTEADLLNGGEWNG